MNFNDYFNNSKYEEDREWHKQNIKNVYNSPRGYFLKQYMELGDFENEVYIRLIKYWNYEKFNGNLRHFLSIITRNTMLSLYEKMDRDKNAINYDITLKRFDKEVGEDEEKIDIPCYDNLFNEKSCINYIISAIDIDIDKEIVKLFLHGLEKTTIAKKLNVTRAFVRHRLENKYNNLMKEKFTEYVNAI